MRMVPNSPYDTRSQAEKRIFDRLRTAFDDSYVAFHSLKPTQHPYKRYPEIDFVICSAAGLFAIEVKGGRVSCHDGLWRYQDKYGGITESQEGPFRQAESALRGLMDGLRADLPASTLHQFVTGYGVAFPDCEWPAGGAEWDEAMIADRRRSCDMEGWLRGLFAYWKTRSSTNGHPDEQTLRLLQDHLRPNIDTRHSVLPIRWKTPGDASNDSPTTR